MDADVAEALRLLNKKVDANAEDIAAIRTLLENEKERTTRAEYLLNRLCTKFGIATET